MYLKSLEIFRCHYNIEKLAAVAEKYLTSELERSFLCSKHLMNKSL